MRTCQAIALLVLSAFCVPDQAAPSTRYKYRCKCNVDTQGGCVSASTCPAAPVALHECRSMCDDALLCHSFVYKKSGLCFLRTYFEGFGWDHPFNRTVLCVKCSRSARMGDMLSAESDIPSLCASPALVELARNTSSPQRDAYCLGHGGCGFLKPSLGGLPHIHTLWATAHTANGSRLERVQVGPAAAPGAELFELGMLVTDTWNGVGGDGWLPVPGPAQPPPLERPANVVALGPRAAGTAARYYRLLFRRGVVAPGTVVRYEQPWRDDACAGAPALHRRVTQEFNVRWRRVDASEFLVLAVLGPPPRRLAPPGDAAGACLPDGAVVRRGALLRATQRCTWRAPAWPPTAFRSCRALRLLDAIAAGAVTRADVELVVAKYQEDISWSDPYVAVRTAYDKGPEGAACAEHRRLPNVGLEQHTYLTHITRHYHELAARTVFMHGEAPSCGFWRKSSLFLGQRPLGLFPFPEVLGGHLLTQVSLHDYLEVCWGCGTLIEIDVHI